MKNDIDSENLKENKLFAKYNTIRKKWDINPSEKIEKSKKRYNRSKDRHKINVNEIDVEEYDDLEDFVN